MSLGGAKSLPPPKLPQGQARSALSLAPLSLKPKPEPGPGPEPESGEGGAATDGAEAVEGDEAAGDGVEDSGHASPLAPADAGAVDASTAAESASPPAKSSWWSKKGGSSADSAPPKASQANTRLCVLQ